MTKTHAELLPCAICLNDKLQVDRLEQNNDWFVTCISCSVWTKLCNSQEEAIKHWNYLYKARLNKETEFLKELKVYIDKEHTINSSERNDDICWGAAAAYGDILIQIQKFQSEAKNENSK